jgi:membrane protein
MKLSAKAWWSILVTTLKNLIKKDFFNNSASVAYYTVFSLPGITMVTIIMARSFLGKDEQAKGTLLNSLTWLMGNNSSKELEHLLYNPAAISQSTFMTILGVVITLWAATTVIVVIKESLNEIWQVRPKPKNALKGFIMNRFVSLQFVASIGFILIVSLSKDALLSVLKDQVDDVLKDQLLYLTAGLEFIFSIGLEVIVFAAIFKILPDVDIKWKNVWLGAVITTIIFTSSKNLITFYIDHSKFNDAYGGAGSLVGMLAWSYFSAMIVFFGAQFTESYNRYIGRAIGPSKNAVAIKVVEMDSKDLDPS